MKVVGIRRIDIVNDNGVVNGYQYHCTSDEDSSVAGVTVEKFFASDRVLNALKRDIQLGDEIMPIYPRESKRLRTILFLDEVG